MSETESKMDKEDLIKQIPSELRLVQVLVTVFAIVMMISFGMIYVGHWLGFILLGLGLIVFIILEIGGWRK